MNERLETKACTHCAKSRRKCGRQRPLCLRCQTRGLRCHYPPSKPTSFILLQDDASCVSSAIGRSSIFPSPIRLHIPDVDDPVASWWFASPQTWTIDPPSRELLSTPGRFSSADFDYCLQSIFDWLVQWVETGSSPIVHRQLYRTYTPTAIQDAYMVLSAYSHKTPLNTSFVHRILEDRVLKLVTQGLSVVTPVTSPAAISDNLSRVHAFLIYQCISFSDSNIRLRHLAEQHMPVLEEWLVSLMQQAQQALCFGSAAIQAQSSHPDQQFALTQSGPDVVPPEQQLWHAWIMAESTRRLWLSIAGLQGLYKLFTRPDLATPCLGGAMFTSRQGFWEAPSAVAWERLCVDRYAGLVRSTETVKLFEMVPRSEMSEFTKLVLVCTFGAKSCENWGV